MATPARMKIASRVPAGPLAPAVSGVKAHPTSLALDPKAAAVLAPALAARGPVARRRVSVKAEGSVERVEVEALAAECLAVDLGAACLA